MAISYRFDYLTFTLFYVRARFGQAEIASTQWFGFRLEATFSTAPQQPYKMMLNSKVVKIDSKIIRDTFCSFGYIKRSLYFMFELFFDVWLFNVYFI